MKYENDTLTSGGIVLTCAKDTTLISLVGQVKTLSREDLEKVIVAEGLEVHAGLTQVDLVVMAASFAQNAWYEVIKGSVPDNSAKQHTDRIGRYKAAVEKAKNPPPAPTAGAPRTPRTPKVPGEKRTKPDKAPAKQRTYVITDATAKGGAQSQLIIDAMTKLNRPATAVEITAEVVTTGKLVTRQEPVKVVVYYLNQFFQKKWVDFGESVSVPAPASTPVSEPVSGDPAPAATATSSASSELAPAAEPEKPKAKGKGKK